ncbi:MAG TPA: NAD kinase [Prolixibacteraceae bacterium]|nr:MAG: NAD kinase [Bacteroidetes bacterium GWB2_41_8]HCY39971.1 NAD kinase [Prolixibacteraceae bacterium]
MKIALYGLTVNPDFTDELARLLELLKEKQIENFVYRPFLEYIQQECNLFPEVSGVFENGEDLPADVSYIFSLGGDGTLLKSFTVAQKISIPLVGINSGRLGFLSDISRDEIECALDDIISGNIIIDERTVLELEVVHNDHSDFHYALNEITVTKLDSSSMINIHALINNEFLNTYWADGLIVATPTGSTAYSLSVGGPILTPDSQNFVISPIAPHHLTVRPIVVPDHNLITLRVEGRGLHFLTSVDSQSEAIYFSVLLMIRKASFNVKTVRLKDHNFFSTLRNKLMWGVDKRN